MEEIRDWVKEAWTCGCGSLNSASLDTCGNDKCNKLKNK